MLNNPIDLRISLLTESQLQHLESLKECGDIPIERIDTLIDRYVEENTFKTHPCEKHPIETISFQNKECKICKFEELEKDASLLRIKKAKIKANVPPRYADSTFENFITNEKSESVVTQLKNIDHKNNVLLLGNTGTGKTHLAFACIDNFLHMYNDVNGIYIQYYKLTDIKIRDFTQFEEILNIDFLIIDEFGVQGSDFKSNLLFEIVNHRYNFLLPTFIISNLNTTQFKESINDALYSRFKENYSIFLCNWEDYRLREKE